MGNERGDQAGESDPVREMFIELFMAPGYLSFEPDRIFTRKAAEFLYEEMLTKGAINLDREDILRLTQKFGDSLFQRIESAPDN